MFSFDEYEDTVFLMINKETVLSCAPMHDGSFMITIYEEWAKAICPKELKREKANIKNLFERGIIPKEVPSDVVFFPDTLEEALDCISNAVNKISPGEGGLCALITHMIFDSIICTTQTNGCALP